MLDECGVEHRDNDVNRFVRYTRWDNGGKREVRYEEWSNGTTRLDAGNVTPEQAIAATVGATDEWKGKPFVDYAAHVAKKLADEAFDLMEGCDEPDFSAIDRIYGLCGKINDTAKVWRMGESQRDFATVGTIRNDVATSEQERIVCDFLRRMCPNRLWKHLSETEHAYISELVSDIAATLNAHSLNDAKVSEKLSERSCASCPEMDNPDSYIRHLQSALKWHDEHVPRPTNPRNTCVVLEGENPPEEVLFIHDEGGVTHYLPEATCKQEDWSTEGDHARVWLTCGHDCMVETVADLPKFCQECGAMVVAE